MDDRKQNHSKLRLTEAGYERLTPHFPFGLKGYALYGHIARLKGTTLNQKTVCRILERNQPVTHYSLEILFAKFGFKLRNGDWEPFPTVSRAAHKHYHVPHERSKCFTGRTQELETLRALLHKNNIVAISGLGGIGKTQTALAYCHRHKHEYDYVFWLRVEADSDVQQGYAEIARHLKLPGTALGEPEQAAAALRWLETRPNWLLVVDNLDKPETGKTYLPRNPQGHILVTTRARHLDILTPNAPFCLETLSPPESLEFLLHRCQRPEPLPAERDAAAELAFHLGYLPLALEQAGAYIAHITTFANYLALYKKRKLAQLKKSSPAFGEYPTTVSATWEINFQAIEEEARQTQTAGKYAAELLRFSAFLAPDDIPLEIVRRGSEAFCPELHTLFEETEDDAEAEEIYNEVLEPLTRYSLAAKNLETRAFRLHRMVQAVTQDRLLESERLQWKDRAVRAVNSAFPVPEFENWPLCERLLPHALAVCDMTLHEQVKTEAAGQLLNNAGRYLFACGRYPLAETYYLAALQIQQEIHAEDHPQIAVSFNSLGLLRHYQGRSEEAEKCIQRSLEIRRRILPDPHIDIAECLNDLAGFYDHRGLYDQAAPLYQQALEITRRFLPEANQYHANILHNLGLLYYRQQRDEEAESHYAQSLQIWRGHLHPNHPLLATCLHNMAQLYRRQCRIAEAEPLYREALSIQQQIYPNGHPDLAITHHNIALLYEHTGRHKEAEHHFTQMLDIDRKSFGEDHAEVAASLKILAAFHERQKQGKNTA